MNRDQYDPQDVAQERALLEHFRVQSQAEPSAGLDARILAAARAAQPSVRPSWSQRLHRWLFGHAGRQRWSLAVAGLASVGIGVSLTLRTLEQAPDDFAAPMPRAVMAPAAPMADTEAPPALLREQAAAPGYAEPRQKIEKHKSMSALMEGAVKQAPAEAEALADAPASSAELPDSLGSMPAASMAATRDAENMLMQLLELRRAGKTQEARRLQQRLQLDYPQMEIEAQLERIGRSR
ncbi:hypothetical protein LJY18_20580 [Pseudomonas sp. MMS21-TM103]|uniref:hypothetical protein n=1 Tax=Pseudomonas sp. MMS21 TM103 TaxID=2886506 RepID=UPI001EDD2AD5|nr:hypothetical protein [Pseudomonas sp. MMS21 TM103]MCG4455669.1 hypothetical protein [Pseudomonas sp. MMS21 TM103]